MGVFARLLWKSRATEEASAAEARTGTEPAGPEAEETTAAEESARTTASAEGGTEDATARAETESVEGVAKESAEIPQQHSADEVADSTAREGARR
ncbi:hypothetical protein ACWCQN_07265 [Streptomyces sp. NPDC001984]